ncbi:HNH endonuclease [Antribacter sp. KLBMP9083]|uniref:HNH endonuclease n=1 Tax=Antribacter soli TaxID=2910976 RepID=A0AA41U8M4_9MICO|nr:HNH endonuclease signature motif containing protein [Antribacter soli]MCF4122881.1 HNH endonuclease [Antribacter soli]
MQGERVPGGSGLPGGVPGGPVFDGAEVPLGSLLPGAGLVGVLAGLEPADEPDSVLVEVVVAWERVMAFAAARQAAAAGELAARRAWSTEREHLGDELAAAIGHSANVGQTLVARGEALAELPEVRDALTAGDVCARKTDVLAFTGAFPTVEDRRAATARVLAGAPRLGLRSLRRRMLAEAAAVSTEAAEVNRKAAAEQRHVRLEPVENGMAYLTAYLPAPDAAAVWSAIDDAGTAIHRTPDETRTLGQARADALVALATGRSVPAGHDTDTGTALRVVEVRPQVRVTVSAATLLGLDNAPGDLTGYGPVTAEAARTLAQDGTWQRLLTDPVTGVLIDWSTTTYTPGKVLRRAVEARDGTCTFPMCDRPAERGDLDHITPFNHHHPSDHTPGQTRADNLHALCRRHHRAKTHGRWRPERDPATGTTTWTSPTGRLHHRPATIVDPARL